MPTRNQLRLFLAFWLLFAGLSSLTAQSAQKNSFNRERRFDVQHYTIRVGFDRRRKIVFGDTTVRVKPLKKGFDRMELDAAQMRFDSVKLESDNRDVVYRVDDSKIYLTFDRPYSPDDSISIRFKYSTKPKKGIYFVEAETEDGKVTRPAQVWTQGEPEESRHWFPSYDFPDDKATSEQYITVDAEETAVGNGELLETIVNPDQTKTFHYRMNVPHSVYLTSFVVGTYVKTVDAHKNIPLGFYMYPGSEPLAKQIFGKTGEMMRVYEELTRVAFPFNKYDQTIVAQFDLGGMENITATTMGDAEVFFGKSLIVEDLVAHELAHSWFGNLVTCRNWAELWLNEGFATYMEAAYREKIYGREEYLRKILEESREFIAADAVGKNRHALYNQTARPDESLFDTTNYSKGSAVVHTLRETVGAENFWTAINVYLNRHKFQNVETSDLQKVMEETSKTDLEWFFKQWVYGGGYPKLKIEPVYDLQKKRLELKITQTQDDNGGAVPEAFILPMQVEITTAKETKIENLRINKRQENFSIKLDEEPLKITFDAAEKIPLKTIKLQATKLVGQNDKK